MINITLSPCEIALLRGTFVPTALELTTRKARVLLALNDGLCVQEVADAYFLCTKTVYRYVRAYQDGGVEGLLAYHKPSGRPSGLPDDIAGIIAGALVRSPATIESLQTPYHNWTLELMQAYLEQEHGVKISPHYAGRLLQRYGFHHIYSRRVMTSTDPQYTQKRAVVDTLKKTWRKARSKRGTGLSRATK